MPEKKIESFKCYRENPKHQAAIVFVHGFSGDPEKTWGNFPELLKTENQLSDWDIYSLGYPTGLLPDIVGIWKAQPDIATVARSLATTTNLEFGRYQSIAWVAHSMGGLALQQALVDDEQFASKAGYVFLFGTPSDGLIKASFVKFWKPSVRDMSKDSSFIVDLRKRWSQKYIDHPTPFDLFVTAGDQDEFVPRQASLKPFLESQRERCFVIPGDHLSIVKPTDSKHFGFQLLVQGLTKNAADIIQANAAHIALEKQQCQQTIKKLEANKQDLTEEGLVRLALAYESVGHQKEAFELLESECQKITGQTETVLLGALGVFAGRLKRRWIEEERKSDAERALKFYCDGFNIAKSYNDPAQAFYHGINLAFMKLAYKHNLEAARQHAKEVLTYCEQASLDKWCLATQGEANYILDNNNAAIAFYQKAIDFKPAPTPRELDSMYQQAIRLTSIFGDEETTDKFQELFGRKS